MFSSNIFDILSFIDVWNNIFYILRYRLYLECNVTCLGFESIAIYFSLLCFKNSILPNIFILCDKICRFIWDISHILFWSVYEFQFDSYYIDQYILLVCDSEIWCNVSLWVFLDDFIKRFYFSVIWCFSADVILPSKIIYIGRIVPFFNIDICYDLFISCLLG